jgi:glutathione S-transferase
LEEKYKRRGTELIPAKDIKARFIFEQAAYIEAFNFDPPASNMVREKLFKRSR